MHDHIKRTLGCPWWSRESGRIYLKNLKNLPANKEDMGLIPGLGRSHMPWSMSP